MTALDTNGPKILGYDPLVGRIIEHSQLRPFLTITRLQLKTPGLQVWTGNPGLGKTIAAQQLVAECNRGADAGEQGAYRAEMFATAGDVDI
jgi:hypothetical protein